MSPDKHEDASEIAERTVLADRYRRKAKAKTTETKPPGGKQDDVVF